MTVASQMKKIGISIGDPAGIGPELALRAAARIDEFPDLELVLIGDAALLGRVASMVGLPLPPATQACDWEANRRSDTQRTEDPHRLRASIVSTGDLFADTVVAGQWT